MAFLVRVDSKNTHGWQVRAGPRDDQRSRLFSDRKNGGPAGAHIAALAHKAEMEALAAPTRPDFGPREKLQANNRSGIVGVRAEYRPNRQGEAVYLYITASWGRKGVPFHRSFSANEHGVLEAVRLALEARAAGSGRVNPYTPAVAWEMLRARLDETRQRAERSQRRARIRRVSRGTAGRESPYPADVPA